MTDFIEDGFSLNIKVRLAIFRTNKSMDQLYQQIKINIMKAILLFFLFLIGNLVQTGTPTEQAIASAQNSYSPFTRPLQSIFSSLPNQVDLQQMIYSADAVALTRLIQIIEVKGDQIPCDALGVYTQSIIGMIKSAKHRKELLVSQMDVIYETAKSQIARIQKELLRLQNEKNSLNLKQLRDNILLMVIQLDNAYEVINTEQKKVEGFRAQIIGYQTDIKLKQQETNQKRKSLIQKKLQVSSYDTQIAQLELKLADLRQQRILSKQDADNLQKKIQDNTQYIELARQKISGIEKAIESLNVKIDSSKRRASELEVSLERFRNQLNSSTNKDSVISQQINALKKQRAVQQSRFLEREHEILLNMIKVWGLILPKFEELSAKIYYDCYGEGSVNSLKTGNVNVYILNGANIPDYIFNNYGFEAFSSGSRLRQTYEFYVADIFGSSWQLKYGKPFADSQSVLQSNDLYISGDFSCLNPSLLTSGQGTITNISKNTITVKNNNSKTVQLKLGACSRIETTKIVPQKGQNIYYKGIVTESGINLYTASCF